jgi:putative protease
MDLLCQKPKWLEDKKLSALVLSSELLKPLCQDEKVRGALQSLREQKLDIRLSLPPVGRNRAQRYCDSYFTDDALRLFSGYYCNNLDMLAYLQGRFRHQPKLPMPLIIADYALYSCNYEAAAFLREHGCGGIVASPELNHYEWEDLLKRIYAEKPDESAFYTEYLVYGHVPFMQSAGCVKKTMHMCDSTDSVVFLTDRMGKKLPVQTRCDVCENTIYNSVPTLLKQELPQILCDAYQLSFTIEDQQSIREILQAFIEETELPDFEYTKGHFKKGIE